MKPVMFQRIMVNQVGMACASFSLLVCLSVSTTAVWAGEGQEGAVGSRAVTSPLSTTPLVMPTAGTLATQTATGQGSPIYVSITGKAQGKFRGEIQRAGYENKFAGLSVEYVEFRKPDPTTGMPLGRQWLPVKIKKLWGAASPQLFTALTTNESLSSVVIDFVVVNQSNMQEVLDHSITLTDAVVTSWSYQMENVNGQAIPVESVEFMFNKITLTDVKSQGVAADIGVLARLP